MTAQRVRRCCARSPTGKTIRPGSAFRGRYDPLLRRWCRGYGLDDDSIDEVCQRIWIELADRMRTFHYDPNRTFRGWLRRVCESRVVDFLRQRQAVSLLSLDDRDGEPEAGARAAAIDSGRERSRRRRRPTCFGSSCLTRPRRSRRR